MKGQVGRTLDSAAGIARSGAPVFAARRNPLMHLQRCNWGSLAAQPAWEAPSRPRRRQPPSTLAEAAACCLAHYIWAAHKGNQSLRGQDASCRHTAGMYKKRLRGSNIVHCTNFLTRGNSGLALWSCPACRRLRLGASSPPLTCCACRPAPFKRQRSSARRS